MSTFPELRTAVVTGTGSERGIGRHVARRLAREGWALAVLDLNADAVLSFADELGAESEQPVLGIAADVADPASVETAFTRMDAVLPPNLAVMTGEAVAVGQIIQSMAACKTTA